MVPLAANACWKTGLARGIVQNMATAVLDALVTRRISHATAARRMREIVARAKTGWPTAPG